jgi:ABC-2 type transport system ATP-binding protein
MTMTDTAIEVRDLHRQYRVRGRRGQRAATTVDALRGVNLSVPAGHVFGLLGPNGAGKTTLTKILATLLVPTSGTARVAGHDVERETRAVRYAVGCVFGGDAGLYDRLSGRDNLRYFATLYGVPRHAARDRIDRLLDEVGLTVKADARVETYSRGMRQRLHIARGLLHDPQVLLLDEPTIGIDPVGARQLRGLVRDLRARGKTILLTTHYMFEAEELCDEIAVITAGHIVARGSAADLKGLAELGQIIELELRGATPETIAVLRTLASVTSVSVEDRDQVQLLRVHTDGSSGVLDAVRGAVGEVPLGRVGVLEPTLEDAYVQIIEGAAAQEEAARVS